ncbi:hypothetical protein HMPREF9134_00056 [Porphyromonas catoniae F0037]|uniref:Uncharacterized protein n=1 Tax=Porphyromonas catoniae F0037 TaxID=1127696 RepID=L1NJF4_9PORP|nr:hypothetical protein HMPREF9134_00056 [Porphyromonas catoniae F0037]
METSYHNSQRSVLAHSYLADKRTLTIHSSVSMKGLPIDEGA